MNRATINRFKTALLFIAPGVLVAAFGYAIGGLIGWALCGVAYSLIAAMVYLSAEEMILNQHLAEYIPDSQSPGLHALVSELARRAGAPMPTLYLLPEPAPQLLVMGRNAKRAAIGLSRGLLDSMSTEEQAAAIAHAIDHLRSGETGPMTTVAGIVGGLISISNFFCWSNLLSPKLLGTEQRLGIASDAFLWTLIAPFAAMLIRGTVHPSRQFRADQASAHLIGDTIPLCAALAKIEANTPRSAPTSVSAATAHLFLCSPTLAGEPMDLFRTHPPVTERLRRMEDLGRTIQYFQRLSNGLSQEHMKPKIFTKQGTSI